MIRWKTNRLGNTAKRTQYAGEWFQSGLEKDLYTQLLLRVKAGELTNLTRQSRVKLTEAQIVYIPDFMALKNGELWYFEAKGFETEVWAIKLKLYRVYGPAPLEIWKGNKRGLFLTETVYPALRA